MVPGKTEVALIQVRQGEKADLRQLEEGQFGFAIDTGELFIGAPSEKRLSGREFRNLKLLTELNGVSSSTISLLDVALQHGTDEATLKLLRYFTDGSIVETDNIEVLGVLKESDASRFIPIESIYNLAIAAGDTTSDKIPSLNSINLTLDNRLQYYIRNDAKWIDLISPGSTDGDHITTPISVDRTITDRLTNYITKLELPQVVTNIGDPTFSNDNITTIYSLLNVISGTSQTKIYTLPSASTTSAGLLTASDYAAIQEYDERISKLEAGGVWRGSYENMIDLPTSREDPSLAGGYADINDFVTVVNGRNPSYESGQAVFRLVEFDETTGAIPEEQLTVAQTSGSSLIDLDIDKGRFKRHTGIDFDTSIVYTYSNGFDYTFDGFATDSGSPLIGEKYYVGDIVGYRSAHDHELQFEVISTDNSEGDGSGGITGLNLITTSGYEEITELEGILQDVATQVRHKYPKDPSAIPVEYNAAVVKISSSLDTSSPDWIDEEFNVIDLDVYGITYDSSSVPVVGDEITVDYTASGWKFDYWISVNISIATDSKAGVVKSSNDINKVSVGLDGTMTVNSYQVHEQRITSNTNALTEKVSIAQGLLNEGKILIVDTNGNLTLTVQRLNDGIWNYTTGEFNTQANVIDDWNTLPSGIYNLTTDSNTLHPIPGDTTGNDYHVTTTTYNGKTLQIAVDLSNPMRQFTRVYDGSTWSAWNYAYASWVPGNN